MRRVAPPRACQIATATEVPGATPQGWPSMMSEIMLIPCSIGGRFGAEPRWEVRLGRDGRWAAGDEVGEQLGGPE